MDEKNWVICLVSYHAYSQSYNIVNKIHQPLVIFTFQFSTDESKKLVTVSAKYVSAFETSYGACLENAMDYSEP